MSEPRSISGSRFHQVGTDAYAVALSRTGEEVSERHHGHTWVAMTPDANHFLFVDDSGSGGASRFTLTQSPGSGARVAVFLDGDLVNVTSVPGALYKGETITVDWSSMYDAMR